MISWHSLVCHLTKAATRPLFKAPIPCSTTTIARPLSITHARRKHATIDEGSVANKTCDSKSEEISKDVLAEHQEHPHTAAVQAGKRRRRPKDKSLGSDIMADIDMVTPGSEKHHDLASFMAYAKDSSLGANTTTYVGTLYEYTVIQALVGFGFLDLKRTGRKSDLGIDLVGHWTLPGTARQLKVLLQCKAMAAKPSPSWIRELEGMYVGAPSSWNAGDTLGLLVASREATKGVLEAVTRSRLPLGFLNVDREGAVLQFTWNHVAAAKGLQGIGAALRHIPETESGQTSQEIVLTWNGHPWSPLTK